MPKLIAAMREEISRVTRQELKACVASMNRAFAAQSKEIAALRRQVAAVMRGLTAIQSRTDGLPLPLEDADQDGDASSGALRFSPKGLRAHRKRLKLSAEQFAKLLGVSAPSIYAWEQGRVRPRARQLRALSTLRAMSKRDLQLRLASLDQ